MSPQIIIRGLVSDSGTSGRLGDLSKLEAVLPSGVCLMGELRTQQCGLPTRYEVSSLLHCACDTLPCLLQSTRPADHEPRLWLKLSQTKPFCLKSWSVQVLCYDDYRLKWWWPKDFRSLAFPYFSFLPKASNTVDLTFIPICYINALFLNSNRNSYWYSAHYLEVRQACLKEIPEG